MGKKVISKGYTLEVKSWENDGDNSRTINHTVESREEAHRLYRLCKELFPSKNYSKYGVGNSMDNDFKDDIFKYIRDNQDLFSDFGKIENFDELYEDLLEVDFCEELKGKQDVFVEITSYLLDVSYSLMGGSELYD